MPAFFTHAIVGSAIGAAFAVPNAPRRYWIWGAICGALPDIDVIGSLLGIPDHSLLGHRGFTHSLIFAVLAGWVVAATAFRDAHWRGHRARLWSYFSLATATHGLLDALTRYGHGVAAFAPFYNRAVSFPWHPIGTLDPRWQHSPFWWHVAALLGNELLWTLGPALVLVVVAVLVRRALRRRAMAAA